MVRRALIALLLCLSAGGVHACGERTNVVGETTVEAGTRFVPDDRPDASSPASTGVCPTNKCEAPFATCPSSRFPCDVDLMNDPNNCGRCGAACPSDDGPFGATFACNAGSCVMKCAEIFREVRADCDGAPDNGCETRLRTRDNCGACGDKCAAGEPCVDGKCGCPAPLTNCDGSCLDLTKDDFACGTCSTACSDPKPPPPHAYYGCSGSTCGHLKCDQSPPTYSWADCNQDATDGCEVDLYALEDANCGACGNSCPAGQHCALYFGSFGLAPRCSCPPGTQECPGHFCVDTASDIVNCGSCGRSCPNPGLEPHGSMACIGGECKLLCADGYADCNDNPTDGCEVNLKADPRNCGACAASCNAVAGQACIAGACAVEPCGGVE